MPRYFFHLEESGEFRDDHGMELPDEDTARRHGAAMLGQVLRDDPRALWASDQIRVTATKDDGVVIFTLETTAERC
jgi:hypothetical protein